METWDGVISNGTQRFELNSEMPEAFVNTWVWTPALVSVNAVFFFGFDATIASADDWRFFSGFAVAMDAIDPSLFADAPASSPSALPLHCVSWLIVFRARLLVLAVAFVDADMLLFLFAAGFKCPVLSILSSRFLGTSLLLFCGILATFDAFSSCCWGWLGSGSTFWFKRPTAGVKRCRKLGPSSCARSITGSGLPCLLFCDEELISYLPNSWNPCDAWNESSTCINIRTETR